MHEIENKLHPLPTDANAPLCAFCGERDADFLIIEQGRRVPSCSDCNEEWVLEEAKAAARRRELELTPEMPDRADVDF